MVVNYIEHLQGIILLVPLLSFALHVLYNVYLHPLRKFPGPRLWAATHIPRHWTACSGQLEWKMKMLHDHYGPVVRYSPDELSFVSEDAWKDIYGFQNRRSLIKDPGWYHATKANNNQVVSIVNAEDAAHDRIRKQLSPAFSEKALREQEPLVTEYVDCFLNKLEGLVGQPVDLVTWYNYLIFDLIGDLALGTSFDCLQTGQYHDWVSRLFNTIKLGPYIRAIGQYTDPKRLIRLLAPSSIKESRTRHDAYVAQAAAQRLAKGTTTRKDFISPILAGKDDNGGLSSAEFAANCGFLILAGSETTATALSGITFNLLMRPECLVRATNEVRAMFDREEDITFQSSAAHLPYLQACISEGMRIYPPTPNIFPRRTTEKEMKISSYIVPANTSVGVHVLSANLSKANFVSPEVFVPERWLAEKADKGPYARDSRKVVQPFSVGPRNCLGQSLAMNEMRTILARLLWKFDLRLRTESKAWNMQKTYTFWEKGPLMIELAKPQASS